MPHKIRAITLDLDNTLWDVLPVIRKAEENSYRYLQKHYPRVADRFTVDDVPNLRERILATRSDLKHDLTAVRKQLYVDMLIECEYDPSDADLLMNRFLIDRNKVEFYPDTIPALKALSERYPLVSLSDGNSDLEAIGISGYFAGCVYAADVGYAKPHPAGFLKACEIAGFAPGETVHIGDHPIYDIAGAREAGLVTMWIRRNGEEWEAKFAPDFSVTTLSEAVEILC